MIRDEDFQKNKGATMEASINAKQFYKEVSVFRSMWDVPFFNDEDKKTRALQAFSLCAFRCRGKDENEEHTVQMIFEATLDEFNRRNAFVLTGKLMSVGGHRTTSDQREKSNA